MNVVVENRTLHVRPPQPLEAPFAADIAAEISSLLQTMRDFDRVRIDLSGFGIPDAAGWSVLLAAANECRALSLEFRVLLPAGAAALASDLRLHRLMVVENPEASP